MAKRPKRPRDPIQLAKLIGDIATGQVSENHPKENDDPAFRIMRESGKLGGIARAESLTPKRRKEIARKAAQRRWGNKKNGRGE